MATITRSFLVPHDDTEAKGFVAGLELFSREQKVQVYPQHVTIDAKTGRTAHLFTVLTNQHTAGRKLRKLYARAPQRFQWTATL